MTVNDQGAIAPDLRPPPRASGRSTAVQPGPVRAACPQSAARPSPSSSRSAASPSPSVGGPRRCRPPAFPAPGSATVRQRRDRQCGGGPGGDGFGPGGGAGLSVEGTVTAVDADSVTIKTLRRHHDRTVDRRGTEYHQQAAADASDVTTGSTVIVRADGFAGRGAGRPGSSAPRRARPGPAATATKSPSSRRTGVTRCSIIIVEDDERLPHHLVVEQGAVP